SGLVTPASALLGNVAAANAVEPSKPLCKKLRRLIIGDIGISAAALIAQAGIVFYAHTRIGCWFGDTGYPRLNQVMNFRRFSSKFFGGDIFEQDFSIAGFHRVNRAFGARFNGDEAVAFLEVPYDRQI